MNLAQLKNWIDGYVGDDLDAAKEVAVFIEAGDCSYYIDSIEVVKGNPVLLILKTRPFPEIPDEMLDTDTD